MGRIPDRGERISQRPCGGMENAYYEGLSGRNPASKSKRRAE